MSSPMNESISAGFAPGGNTARHAEVRERLVPNPKARLQEQFHEVCRFKHLALRSEEAYWAWVVRLVKHFDSKVNPRDLSGEQLAGFLTHRAAVNKVRDPVADLGRWLDPACLIFSQRLWQKI